jgi:ubiquinone/menaquinone biosynthesis C-methylase UbiE
MKRYVNPKYDTLPSISHKFCVSLLSPYFRKKCKILDIGCWSGQFVGLLDQQYKIVGIDIDKKVLEFAKSLYPHVKFVKASALNLPFRNKLFDIVTLLATIEHLPKRSEHKILKEIHRVLKPNGYLLISTMNNQLLSKLLDPAYFLTGHRHYSAKQMKNILKKAGFTPVKIITVGGIFRMSWHIFELLVKHIVNKTVQVPGFIQKKIQEEYEKGGFSELYILAKAS